MMFVTLLLLNVREPSIISTILTNLIPPLLVGVRTWWPTIERHATLPDGTRNKDISIILIGNKAESPSNPKTDSASSSHRIISTAQGQELADKLGIRFMETSAKTSERVMDAFVQLARYLSLYWCSVNFV
jgi:GTPase SAR1 family protein